VGILWEETLITLKKHFGEFLVAKMLLIATIFSILVYERSVEIVASAK